MRQNNRKFLTHFRANYEMKLIKIDHSQSKPAFRSISVNAWAKVIRKLCERSSTHSSKPPAIGKKSFFDAQELFLLVFFFIIWCFIMAYRVSADKLTLSRATILIQVAHQLKSFFRCSNRAKIIFIFTHPRFNEFSLDSWSIKLRIACLSRVNSLVRFN